MAREDRDDDAKSRRRWRAELETKTTRRRGRGKDKENGGEITSSSVTKETLIRELIRPRVGDLDGLLPVV